MDESPNSYEAIIKPGRICLDALLPVLVLYASVGPGTEVPDAGLITGRVRLVALVLVLVDILGRLYVSGNWQLNLRLSLPRKACVPGY
jgi:hypothetical protein